MNEHNPHNCYKTVSEQSHGRLKPTAQNAERSLSAPFYFAF